MFTALKPGVFIVSLLLGSGAFAANTPIGREEKPQPVVLLHGMARSASSMQKMADALTAAGFAVCNVEYPSLDYPIEELATAHVLPAIGECFPDNKQPIDFVTHSLGGIIVRQLAAMNPRPGIGRVIMLSPPNQGSELTDVFNRYRLFETLHVPAGAQLGTLDQSVPNRLGSAAFDVGIITGDRTVNPLLSSMIPGADDGKVSVDRAMLAGMRDFLVVHASHPFIMRNDVTIEQAIRFLRTGTFSH